MTPIMTVTLNPALDIATSTARVVAGPKLRCDPPRHDPGGGGINVSRVITRLGGESTAFVALGGATGERLAALLDGEGTTYRRHAAPGETRESFAIHDREADVQYRFVLPGADWGADAAAAVVAAIVDEAAEGALVVLSGSLPSGMPEDTPAVIAGRLARKSGRLILDTSGAVLARAARPDTPVHVLRMDENEAEALAGARLKTRGDSADFAESLIRQRAAEIVLVARGPDGSVMATATERHFVKAAEVPVKSKVGAGDSFLAAFTLALARLKPLPEALQEGMAAASAAVMTEATDLCRAEDATRLIAECPVSPI